MSLADAVSEIADQMEAEGKEALARDAHGDLADLLLRQFARQLRSAVKASAGQPAFPAGTFPQALGAESQHSVMIQQERAKLRAQKIQQNDLEEEAGETAREFADGPFADAEGGIPNHIPVRSDLPVGARLWPVKGSPHVYELRQDGRLHYVESQATLSQSPTGSIILSK